MRAGAPSPGWGAELLSIWVYLGASPLLWLTLTLAAYAVGEALQRRAGGSPLVNPVLIAVALLVGILGLTGTPYRTYFDGAQFVHFLLGPATVAIAVPIHRNRERLRRSWARVGIAVLAGSVAASLSAIAVAGLLGAPAPVLASLAPKSATTPVAMAVAQGLGGEPSLAAVFVILTGVLGAMLSTPLFDALGITSKPARGLGAGVAAHGIGTAYKLRVDPVAGAHAGLGMGLNAALTALVVPTLFAAWTWLASVLAQGP